MALSPRHGSADRAVWWSLVGHGLLVLIVVLGGLSLPHSPPRTQLAIKATVVDSKAAARPRPAKPAARPEARPEPKPESKPESKPEPKPEPKPPPKAEAPPAPKPDPRLEQRKAEQQKEMQKLEREKAAARKAEADKQKVEQAKAKAEARAEAEKQKVVEEKTARAKAEAERRKAAEEAAARDVSRQLEEEEKLLAAEDSGALADYIDMIGQRVERNWLRPPGAKAGLECEVVVTQIPGGQVTAVQVARCNADEVVRRSIEAAVLRASPLPLPADPALFERNLRFTFKPEQ